MFCKVVTNRFFIKISIAVQAAILASMIHTNIDTCHAATFQTLIFVLFNVKRKPTNSFQTLFINTMCMRNAKFAQVNFLRAGIDRQSIFRCNKRKSFHQFKFFFQRHLKYVKRLRISLRFFIIIYKAYGTLICILMKLIDKRFKVFTMVFHCVNIIKKYWVVSPNDSFFSNFPG